MNTTTESSIDLGVPSEEVDPETERVILDRLASFEEDAKAAVDARDALAGIRQKLCIAGATSPSTPVATATSAQDDSFSNDGDWLSHSSPTMGLNAAPEHR
jgi:hypothetical protein